MGIPILSRCKIYKVYERRSHDAEDELRRRSLHHYEDLKIVENGDVTSFKRFFERLKE